MAFQTHADYDGLNKPDVLFGISARFGSEFMVGKSIIQRPRRYLKTSLDENIVSFLNFFSYLHLMKIYIHCIYLDDGSCLIRFEL